MRAARFLIRGGRRLIEELLEAYRRSIYRYNSEVLRGTGYYLKPVHVVRRGDRIYKYIGRYWWRLERRDGKLKWRYVGTSKPRELSGLPDPPQSPLAGARIEVLGDDVIVDAETLRRLRRILGGRLEVQPLGDGEPSPRTEGRVRR